jgi:hypothetical protein
MVTPGGGSAVKPSETAPFDLLLRERVRVAVPLLPWATVSALGENVRLFLPPPPVRPIALQVASDAARSIAAIE